MKKPKRAVFVVVILSVLVIFFNVGGVKDWLSLVLKNETNPAMDAKCDMKDGFIGCYFVKGKSLEFSIRYPESSDDVCGWVIHEMDGFERLQNIENLSLNERSLRYAVIYNAMVLSSAVYPPKYYDGLDWKELFALNASSYVRKLAEMECRI